MKQFNLSIAEPCHENWQNMTQEDKGKFCNACQKSVIDFTNMSDRQLAEFFKKSPASSCGRFNADQMNRAIDIPKKRIPWLRYFFQFTIPAFLISIKSGAQAKATVQTEQSTVKKQKGFKPAIADTVQPEKIALIATSVVDNSKQIIMGFYVASPKKKTNAQPVTIIKSPVDSAQTDLTVTPNPEVRNGTVTLNLKDPEAGDYTVEILSASGEVLQKETVKIRSKGQKISFTLKLASSGVLFVKVTNVKTHKVYTERLVVM